METDYPIIAVAGGMAAPSSNYSKKLIYDLYLVKTGGRHCPQILSYDLDMCQVEKLQKAGDKEGLGNLMSLAGYFLREADFAILCSNTMHEFADKINAYVPLLDIRETTAKAIVKEGIKKVVLLGTRYTMEQAFYRQVLEEYGLEVIVPAEADRFKVHQIIYEELIAGFIGDDSRTALLDVICGLQKQGAEGVILGCTELPLLLPDDWVESDSGRVRIFDTTKLQAEAAVNLALGLD